MNTYHKYYPKVYLAKCPERHESGDIIQVTTRHGKENQCIVYNLIFERNGEFYYSIVRADGFNTQEWAKRKADKIAAAAQKAQSKSNDYWKASDEGKDFLVLAEPIKIGHHSEKRHRALIERNHNRMNKSVEFQRKADKLSDRAEYYENKEAEIDLSMPESVEFYEAKLHRAKEYYDGLKDGTFARDHAYSLTYARKNVVELEQRFELAKKLWILT